MSEIILNESTAPATPPTGKVAFYAKTDKRMYFKDDAGVETAVSQIGLGTGDLKSDGSTPMTNDWDIGPFKITMLQLETDIPTGTAPLIVASTTLVTNLNSEFLGGTNLAGIQSLIDAAVVGLLDHKGGYDASTNTPDLDTAPSGIKKGDAYNVTVAGTFYAVVLAPGDWLYALIDDPVASSDWSIVQANLDAVSIKTLYESNTDTNEFSDAEQTKLAGIVSGAGTTFEYTSDVATVADQDYVLWWDAPFAGTITLVRTKSQSGTCTLTGKVNTTALGGTANSVTTSVQEQAHASSNTFIKGDKIQFTISANAVCLDMAVEFAGTRS